MAKPKKPQTAAQPPVDDIIEQDETPTDASEPTPTGDEPRPPQGLVPRYLETGSRADFHRYHFGRAGVPDVRRIDPASLRTPEGYDPWLVLANGAVIQVRADHAAELLECDEVTGGASRCSLATEEQIAAARELMKKNSR